MFPCSLSSRRGWCVCEVIGSVGRVGSRLEPRGAEPSRPGPFISQRGRFFIKVSVQLIETHMQMHYAFVEVRKIRLVNLYHNGGHGHKPNKTFVKYMGLLQRNKNILTEYEFFSAAFCEVSKRGVFVCAYFAASLLSG